MLRVTAASASGSPVESSYTAPVRSPWRRTGAVTRTVWLAAALLPEKSVAFSSTSRSSPGSPVGGKGSSKLRLPPYGKVSFLVPFSKTSTRATPVSSVTFAVTGITIPCSTV